MDVWKNYFTELRLLYELCSECETKLSVLKQYGSNLCPQFESTINSAKQSIEIKLKELVRYPPHHSRHFEKLTKFHENANYNNCIFIMTKYCEGDNKKDKELQRVIDAVRNEITECGHIPKLANDYGFHSSIWDNTEIGMLGSARGIAIVEDKYKPELNPNVAMEWGWMTGMGREVLFLMEEKFKHFRADWEGMRRETFSWQNPEPEIKIAINKWFQ